VSLGLALPFGTGATGGRPLGHNWRTGATLGRRMRWGEPVALVWEGCAMPDAAWVDDLVGAWNAFDGEKAASFYTPDGVWRDEALDMRWEGPEQIGEVWGTLAPAAFSDWLIQVTGVVCSEDTFAFEWRMSGTRSDDGTKFDTPGVTFGRVRDGLIVEHTDYYNATDFHTE